MEHEDMRSMSMFSLHFRLLYKIITFEHKEKASDSLAPFKIKAGEELNIELLNLNLLEC